MSSNIEERVLQMQFDNAQFERNASTTLNTLDRLESGLKFTEAKKGLLGFQNASNKFNMNGVTDAIGLVINKFSAFEIIGITALQNIANKGVNYLEGMLKKLTIDNISAGWQKFGDKTTSVATLLGQGFDLELVTEQLDQLNWFTDETSYNFVDMVNSIGKFTASGKGLEESVTALEGIANWAALSGQNATTASRAMYQISQAMGAGVMRKEDYKSIQNVSMDTKEFREHAAQCAVEIGTLRKNSDGTFTSIAEGFKSSTFSLDQFADHLTQEGWFNSEVMMKVFNDYSSGVRKIYDYIAEQEEKGRFLTASDALEEMGDTLTEFERKAFEAAQKARTWADVMDSVQDAVSTGWMKTFELLFGNSEEATELFTAMANELYDVFAEGGNFRNSVLKEWYDAGGRTELIEAAAKAWGDLRAAVDLVGEAFSNVFFPWEKDENGEKSVGAWTEKVIDATHAFADFVDTIHGFMNPAKVSEGLSGFLENSLDENGIKKVELAGNRMENVSKILEGFFSLLHIVAQAFKFVGDVVTDFIGYMIPIGDSILDTAGSFGEWITDLDDAIESTNFFGKILDALQPTLKGFADFLFPIFVRIGELVDYVLTYLSPAEDKIGSFGDTVSEKISPLSKIFEIIGKVFSTLKGIFTDTYNTLKPIIDSIGKVISDLFDKLSGAVSSGNADNILKVINAGTLGLILKGFLDWMNRFKDAKKESPIDSIKTFFQEFKTGIVDALNGIAEAWQNSNVSDSIIKIAAAIGILAAALFILSTIDSDKLNESISAIGMLAGIVGLMAASLSKLSGSNSDGISGIGKIFESLGKSANLITLSAAIMSFAVAIGILVLAVKALGSTDIETLKKGMLSVAALLAMLMGVAYGLSKMKDDLAKGAGSLVLVAAALVILTFAVKGLGSIQTDSLGKGIMALGVVLLELAGFMYLVKSSNFSAGNATAIVILAAAMLILQKAAASFGGMDTDSLSKGLSSMAAILAGLAIFTNVVDSKGILQIGVAMIGMAASMVIFAAAMKIIAGIPVETMGASLASLAAGTLLMVVAANTIGGKGLVAGAAMVVMSAGLIAFALALKVMATVPTDSLATSILAILGALIGFAVVGVILAPIAPTIVLLAAAFALFGLGITLLSTGITALSVALTALAAAIPTSIDIIIQGAAALISGFLSALQSLVPQVVALAITVVVAFLVGIAANIETIVVAAVLIIVGFINGIAKMLPAIVQAAVNMIGMFIYGCVMAISDGGDLVLYAIGSLMKAVFNFVIDCLQELVGMIPGVGGSLAAQMEGWKFDIEPPMTNAFDTMPDAAESSMAKTETALGDGLVNVEGLLDGFSDDLSEYSGMMNTDVLDGLSSPDEYGDVSMENWEAFKEPFNLGGQEVTESATTTSDTVVSVTDISEEMTANGSNATLGFLEGFRSHLPEIRQAAAELTSIADNTVRKGLEIESPSKVFKELGSYTIAGYVLGIYDNLENVASASSEIGNTIIDSVGAATERANKIFDNGYEATPSVRPVVDLSSIQNGAALLNGLVSGYAGMELASGITVRSEHDIIANSIGEKIQKMVDDFNTAIDERERSATYNFEAPVVLNGREIARSSARYTREELNRLNRNADRKEGRL